MSICIYLGAFRNCTYAIQFSLIKKIKANFCEVVKISVILYKKNRMYLLLIKHQSHFNTLLNKYKTIFVNNQYRYLNCLNIPIRMISD